MTDKNCHEIYFIKYYQLQFKKIIDYHPLTFWSKTLMFTTEGFVVLIVFYFQNSKTNSEYSTIMS